MSRVSPAMALLLFACSSGSSPPNEVSPEKAAREFVNKLGFESAHAACGPKNYGSHTCTARVDNSEKTFSLECAAIGATWFGCQELCLR